MARIFRSGRSIPSPKLKRSPRKRIVSIDEDYAPTSPERAYRRPSRIPSPSSSDSPPPPKKAKKRSSGSPRKPTAIVSAGTTRLALSSPSRPQIQTPEEASVVERRPSSLRSRLASSASSNTSPRKKVSFDQSTIQPGSHASRLRGDISRGSNDSMAQGGGEEPGTEEGTDKRTSDLDEFYDTISDILWDFDLGPIASDAEQPPVLVENHQADQKRPTLLGSGGNDADKYLLSSRLADREMSSLSSSASPTSRRNKVGSHPAAHNRPTLPTTFMTKASARTSKKRKRSLRYSPQDTSLSEEDEKTTRTEGPAIMLTKMLNRPQTIFSLDDIAACFDHIQTGAHAWASDHFGFRVRDEEAVKAWPLHLLETKYRSLLLLTEHIIDTSSSGHHGWNHFFTSSDSRVALVYSTLGFYTQHQVFNSIDRDRTAPATPIPFFAQAKSDMSPDEVSDYVTQAAETILTVIEPLLPPSIFGYNTDTRTWAVSQNLISTRDREIIKLQLSVILRNCVALSWAIQTHLQGAGQQAATTARAATTIRFSDKVQKVTTEILDHTVAHSRVDRPNRALKVKMICWPGVEACITDSGAREQNEGNVRRDQDGDVDMLDVHHNHYNYHMNGVRAEEQHVRYKALCEQHLFCVQQENERNAGAQARTAAAVGANNGSTRPPSTAAAAQRRSLREVAEEAARGNRNKYGRGFGCTRVAVRRHLKRHEWKYHVAAMLLGAGWACVRVYKRDNGLSWRQMCGEMPLGVRRTVVHWMGRLTDKGRWVRQYMQRMIKKEGLRAMWRVAVDERGHRTKGIMQ